MQFQGIKQIGIIICFAAFGMLQSCDYVNTPYPKTGIVHIAPHAVVKKVLLEDFTASMCVNCPLAATVADNLRNNNPGRVITIGVHACSLAAPSGTAFPYDFRTTAGNYYNTTYIDGDNTGLPNGMVDMYPWDSTGTNPLPRSVGDYSASWTKDVNRRLSIPDSVYLQIDNVYTVSTRVLASTIKIKYLKTLPHSYKLVVLMTEDSISSPQKTPSATINNYVHRYVLRGAIDGQPNGTGIPITLAPAGSDSTTLQTINYTVPTAFPGAMSCNDNQCYIVAFLYDTITGDVLEVEEQKVR